MYALEEINSHKEEILAKTGLVVDSFKERRKELAVYVEFVSLDEYLGCIDKASNILDKNDVDFIALALKMGCPVWSNDKDLKKQSLIEVYTTGEFIKKYLHEAYLE